MHTEALRNWKLLEDKLTTALRDEGHVIDTDVVGNPCAGGVNIAKLAQALSASGVLVEVTVVSVTNRRK